jgi:hypothetical protein
MITQCDPTLTRRDLSATIHDPGPTKSDIVNQCLSQRRTLSTDSLHVQR